MKKDIIVDNLEYVYLTIPKDFICIYHRLLHYLNDYGIELVEDCQAGCDAKNRKLLDCWSMFQSACAAHSLHNDADANFLIKYITEQLDLMYRNSNDTPYDGDGLFPISDDGHLKAAVTCSTPINVAVDNATGHSYIEYMKRRYNRNYIIENGHLKEVVDGDDS